MKKTLSLSLVSLLLALAAPAVRAQGPEQISYQGRLTNSAGVAIGNTSPENRRVVFRIWNHATSTAPANRLWTEEHTVTVFQGDFSVILGSGLAYLTETRPALTGMLNGADRFIEVSVEEGAGFQTISPRQQITSTAFALRANVAQSVSQLSGTSSFDVIQGKNIALTGPLSVSGSNVLEFGAGVGGKEGSAGKIGYGTFSGNALDIVGAGTLGTNRRVQIYAEGGTTFTGPIGFGARLGQHINLWTDTYGLGIEGGTLFYRSADIHRWYRGGNSGGGGTEAARLDGGGLTLSTGTFNGNLNGNVERGNVHAALVSSFGGGHSFGSQDWTSYSRSSRNFAWYLNGNYNTGELNNGGGTTAAVLTNSGLNIGGDFLRIGKNRPGQQVDAGTIGYATFTAGALDIVGAGTDGGNRKVKVWAEGGTIFNGVVDIASWASRDSGPFTYFARSGTGNAGGAVDVSLKASNRVVASEFNATSDARIKKIAGRSDSSKDLATLLKVQVTDYTKVEDMSVKPRAYKKVIAQQVEEVFPQAVSKMPGTVPDVFAKVTAKAGLISVKAPEKLSLKAGDVLKAFPEKPEPNKPELLLTVKEVTKDGVRVTEPVEGNLFVFGHQVNDLRTVDYEAIAMLNVSATQELHKTIETQAAELKKLREENDALEKELATARDANREQDTRLAAIEKALQAGGGGQSALGSPAPKLKPARSK